MRGLAPLAVLITCVTATGCADGVCAGYAGTCVELTVVGDGTVPALDQLELAVDGFAEHRRTPQKATDPFDLPKHVAVQMGANFAGTITITVDGLRTSRVVAQGHTTASLVANGHSAITVVLQPQLPPSDGGVVDLAPSDAGLGDASPGIDAATSTRILFVTSKSTSGRFAEQVGDFDAWCRSAATGAGHAPALDGRTFKAFVTRPTQNDLAGALAIGQNSTREIVDTNGNHIAAEGDLLQLTIPNPGPHLDERGQMLVPSASLTNCAWTGLSSPEQTGDDTNCAGWGVAGTGVAGMGIAGTAGTNNWRTSTVLDCSMPCRLYCLEIP